MILTQASKRDLEAASADLCKHDLNEFHSHTAGRDPRTVIPTHLDETTMAIKVGSLVLAVGGSKDCLWFVTTNVVDMLTIGERMRFYRLLKEHLKGLREGGHKALTNFVSVDNKPHIRLLESLGATFSKGITMSPAGFAFRQFWL
ncbi:internal virion protein A [Pseudomonas phage ALEA]|uniref:Internal virion protein A n=1 Tax=Pseudomonas phage AH05 TaxID=2869574 RepID=A0AAE7X292_9CAUD|nr:internal virion protein A [Pseudomonas phage AH05]UAV89344.1 internal virion protein A [Pseudomonas phage ALEA]UAV89493.1 internal virion protein A [Pseudomonas phage M1.1]UAV89542.1 internal virion protein A [Pseudomonas phage M1.2]UAV89591.1 internal virion protein A [Pseudomonas phage M3.1]UAV89814.1 internal virion protein A [Pseudomonas phage NOI]UAV90086.1 internal virion protein A [Pseudomonas phage SNK]UGL61091.1 acetyltransferase [Pseudomonas phage Eir4]